MKDEGMKRAGEEEGEARVKQTKSKAENNSIIPKSIDDMSRESIYAVILLAIIY